MKTALLLIASSLLAAPFANAAPDAGAVNLCSYEVNTMVNALVTAETSNLLNAGVQVTGPNAVQPQITYQTVDGEMGVTVNFTVSLGSVQSFASGTATAYADTCTFGSIQRTLGDD